MNWNTIEHKAKHSIDLTEEEVLQLLELEDPSDFARLYALAGEVNERLNGRVVSFVHNMNINYTNLCGYHCSFCEFKKPEGVDGAYIIQFEDVKRALAQTDGTVTELCIQGGLSAAVKFDQVLQLIRQIHEAYPAVHLHAFSPEEIHYYTQETGRTYEEVLRQCKSAGLGSMCGTAAEILDDEVRRKICPEKVTTGQWCEIVRMAHRLGLRSTATILFGHLEESRHVVNHLKVIRGLQRESGMIPPSVCSTASNQQKLEELHARTVSDRSAHTCHTGGGMITEFIPLLFMPDKTKLGRVIGKENDRIRYAFQMIAVSRLYFMNDIRNIQTSWVKLGWDNALHSLSLGANDMSGTLYHENITREAGGQFGEYVPLGRFVSEITRMGKVPVERDTIYSFQRDVSDAWRSQPLGV